MKIVACGLSGLIGKSLLSELTKKYEVVLLKRAPSKKKHAFGNVREVLWDAKNPHGSWASELEDAHAVINLSGEPIADKRWSLAQKEKIRSSRIVTTQALVTAIGKLSKKPHLLLNASAIGFYGSKKEEMLTEESPHGEGFLSDTCLAWEEEADKAKALGLRVVKLRTGLVLSREGGALAKMLPPFKLGLGGPLGSGRQVLSWIHIEDEVGAILWALKTESVDGAINLTSPEANTMAEFSKILAKTLKRPAFFAVPRGVLKMLLGEMSELLLEGQRVYPEKLLKSGFSFRYPSLGKALSNLLSK